MQLVSLLIIICLYMTMSTLSDLVALHSSMRFTSVSAVKCKISPNWSLPRCPLVISPNQFTTNGISSLATEAVICILLLLMISFEHSCKLSGTTNISKATGLALVLEKRNYSFVLPNARSNELGTPKSSTLLWPNFQDRKSFALVRLTWLVTRCSAPKSKNPMFLSILKASHTGRTR